MPNKTNQSLRTKAESFIRFFSALPKPAMGDLTPVRYVSAEAAEGWDNIPFGRFATDGELKHPASADLGATRRDTFGPREYDFATLSDTPAENDGNPFSDPPEAA